MANTMTPATRMMNENNAYTIVIELTQMLRDAVRSDAKSERTEAIRTARYLALERYEDLFGLEELDDTLEILDEILMG